MALLSLTLTCKFNSCHVELQSFRRGARERRPNLVGGEATARGARRRMEQCRRSGWRARGAQTLPRTAAQHQRDQRALDPGRIRARAGLTPARGAAGGSVDAVSSAPRRRRFAASCRDGIAHRGRCVSAVRRFAERCAACCPSAMVAYGQHRVTASGRLDGLVVLLRGKPGWRVAAASTTAMRAAPTQGSVAAGTCCIASIQCCIASIRARHVPKHIVSAELPLARGSDSFKFRLTRSRGMLQNLLLRLLRLLPPRPQPPSARRRHQSTRRRHHSTRRRHHSARNAIRRRWVVARGRRRRSRGGRLPPETGGRHANERGRRDMQESSVPRSNGCVVTELRAAEVGGR